MWLLGCRPRISRDNSSSANRRTKRHEQSNSSRERTTRSNRGSRAAERCSTSGLKANKERRKTTKRPLLPPVDLQRAPFAIRKRKSTNSKFQMRADLKSSHVLRGQGQRCLASSLPSLCLGQVQKVSPAGLGLSQKRDRQIQNHRRGPQESSALTTRCTSPSSQP